ncbi:MAG: hypothetical protein PVH03_06155 [Chloroflexota bacterium]
MGEQGDKLVKQTRTASQKWWKTGSASIQDEPRTGQGQPCPKCYIADLDYDTLFRLRCPNCNYVADCGAFT